MTSKRLVACSNRPTRPHALHTAVLKQTICLLVKFTVLTHSFTLEELNRSEETLDPPKEGQALWWHDSEDRTLLSTDWQGSPAAEQ